MRSWPGAGESASVGTTGTTPASIPGRPFVRGVGAMIARRLLRDPFLASILGPRVHATVGPRELLCDDGWVDLHHEITAHRAGPESGSKDARSFLDHPFAHGVKQG